MSVSESDEDVYGLDLQNYSPASFAARAQAKLEKHPTVVAPGVAGEVEEILYALNEPTV